ncbi:hypothetical protein LPW36_01935 [Jinshanibacter sp. LJY008]|uniref:Uncharacterized protein n=1 Tax=Limnobaculum eriocheiris TaxID=2897391 RepID=A0A9X1SK21_9GAMM|nr:hypothetical protein [Limnobaculum eriocheiris]MCD1124804.1 hypothetical protein [Limnobaculum eriocheiris]
MSELDPRVVIVGIETNGMIKKYEGLHIVARGTKFGNANQNECEIKIANLDKDTRDYLITETSPFNKNKSPKRIYLYVGRQSTGARLFYVGDITRATPTQPPDIELSIKAMTGNHQKGSVIARNHSAKTPLSEIASQVAGDLNMKLVFEATDKNIGNYSFTGSALRQVEKLADTGNLNVYIDDDKIVVKDYGVPMKNSVRVLNLETGLVGIPELTDVGIKVKYLIDQATSVGGLLRVESKLNPAANGNYTIHKLSFEIASRDTPFYFIAEATRA